MVVEASRAPVFSFLTNYLNYLRANYFMRGHKKVCWKLPENKGRTIIRLRWWKVVNYSDLAWVMSALFLVSCGVYKTVWLIYCVRKKFAKKRVGKKLETFLFMASLFRFSLPFSPSEKREFMSMCVAFVWQIRIVFGVFAGRTFLNIFPTALFTLDGGKFISIHWHFLFFFAFLLTALLPA